MKNKISLCGHKELQALTVMNVKCSVLGSDTVLHRRRLFFPHVSGAEQERGSVGGIVVGVSPFHRLRRRSFELLKLVFFRVDHHIVWEKSTKLESQIAHQ